MSKPSYVLFVLAVLSTAVIPWISACASGQNSTSAGPREKTGRAMRVKYLAYASGQRLELVNDSHSDRVETYSKTKSLSDANTKITTDEVLDEVLKRFRDAGYFEHATSGRAPDASGGQALEVEDQGRVTCWLASKTSTPDEQHKFQQCAALFVQVYNGTFGLQAVDRPPDWDAQKQANERRALRLKGGQ